MVKKVDMREAWNKISNSYQTRYEIKTEKIHYGPLCPSEDQLNLLGNVKGKFILELGSGAAQNSIYLSKNGAITTAVDISDEQLNHGKILAEKERVKVSLIRSSFSQFKSRFNDNSFDIVLSVYALQYCTSVKELKKVIKDIYLVLKDNGMFIFSLDHPIRHRGYWDDSRDSFTLDNYFDRDNKVWKYSFPENNTSAEMSGVFFTLEDYISAVIYAGFFIKKFIEPEPIKTDSNSKFGYNSRYGAVNIKDPYSYNHLSRIPGTLIIKGVKLAKNSNI